MPCSESQVLKNTDARSTENNIFQNLDDILYDLKKLSFFLGLLKKIKAIGVTDVTEFFALLALGGEGLNVSLTTPQSERLF